MLSYLLLTVHIWFCDTQPGPCWQAETIIPLNALPRALSGHVFAVRPQCPLWRPLTRSELNLPIYHPIELPDYLSDSTVNDLHHLLKFQVAANGDTANKIGTYQIAIVAKHHDVPFYVAAPLTSVDMSLVSGDRIKIEERPDREMTHIGEHRIAARGILLHSLGTK